MTELSRLPAADMYRTLGRWSDLLVYRLLYGARYWLAACCLLLMLGLGASIIRLGLDIPPYSDSAYYLVLARSLSQGSGLRLVSQPGAPLISLAPPAYPLLLSGLVRLVGLESMVPYRLLGVLFWMTMLVALGLLVGHEDGPLWGFLLLFLAGLNVHITLYAFEILTELPYMTCSFAALFLVQKHLHSSRPRLFLGLAIGAILFSLYLRMIGVTLLAAVVLFLLLRRRLRSALIVGGVVTLLYSPWMVAWKQHSAQAEELAGIVTEAEAERPLVARLAERTWSHTVYYVTSVHGLRPKTLGDTYINILGGARLVAWAGVVVSLVVLVGWAARLRRAEHALVPLYVACYLGGLVVVFPLRVERYLMPVTPLLTWLFLGGVGTLLGVVGARLTGSLLRLKLWFLTACLLMAVSMLLSTGLYALSPAGVRHLVYSPARRSYVEAARWLRENCPPESVIMARKPDTVYLLSDRQAIRYPFVEEAAEMWAFMADYNIAYVIVDDLPLPETAQYLEPFLARNEQAFEQVYAAEDGLTQVYRVLRR